MAPSSSSARAIGVGFATLSLMMAAHAALESARDALLLQALSPDALLWSYVAIAIFALGLGRLPKRRRPLALPSVLALGSVFSIASWFLLPILGPLGAALFYVATALYATIAVPRFWLLLADRFTVRDAKRYYAWIGAGGIGGAVAGSAVSASLLPFVAVRDLLFAGAAFYAVAAVVSRWLAAGAAPSSSKRPPANVSRHRSSREYLRRIVTASLLASATFTVIDYLFKSVAAATIPAEDLASYFARTYAGMNTVALGAQLFLAPVLLRRLGTHAAAALLPTLLLAASGGFAAVGWPLLALGAKGADGALRNSLHRVTSELFYFPLSDDVRQRWKATSDAFGQRGGQAIGALILLALVAAGGTARFVALLAAVFAIAWLAVARSMRAPYAALFREGLRRGTMPVDVRPLASDTLQTILESFSSRDEAIVCSAIDFLAHHGNERLIPSVLVHHPSRRVALRALELLARARPAELAELAQPLLHHADGAIRAATLRLFMQQRRDPQDALRALEDPSADVRATAMLVLSSSAEHREQAASQIEAILAAELPEPKMALARAIQADPRPDLIPLLLRLLETPALFVRREALRAMERLPDRAFLPRLLPLLAELRILPDVRRAILASSFGDSSVVEGWLRDESLPRGVRRHVPRTLSAFETPEAAAALADRLEKEPDGAVRFKILRGLGRMRANRPSLPLDDEVLRRYARVCLDRAILMLEYRAAIAAVDDANATQDRLQELLIALLRDKEMHALERVFRAIGVVQPELALEDVWRGVRAPDARSRDAALEIVDTLSPELRYRLLVMVQDTPDPEKLRAVNGETLGRKRALDAMSADKSRPMSALAAALNRSAR